MKRIILAGDDKQVLPALEALRGSGAHEVVGLSASSPDSLTALYAEIMALPLLTELESSEWLGRADTLASDEEIAGELAALPRLSLAEAASLAGGRSVQAVGAEAAAPSPPQQRDSGKTQPPTAAKGKATRQRRARPATSELLDFARELQREIRRSERYHLGFCLTLLRLEDAQGRPLEVAAYRHQPLRGFESRHGRISDCWGLSAEGIVLHLAPETPEQAVFLRRRLVNTLQEESQRVPGGPWQVRVAQALYPRDGEEARELIAMALARLEMGREESGGGA